MSGKLYIVATPIGNIEDITIRAINTLLSAKVIFCEDTRKTGHLLQKINSYKIDTSFEHPSLFSYFEENEAQRIPFVIRMTSVVAMAIIMGNTLFKFVFSEQKEIPLATKNLNIISASAGSFLGALLLLVTIMAIPHIFAKDESDTNS